MTLELAILEARRIRRNLVRARRDRELGGECGFASMLLADALGSPSSLRMVDGAYSRHVWNEINGTIIDITATQFNGTNDFDVSIPRVHGVLITREPRVYHASITWRGRTAANAIAEGMLCIVKCRDCYRMMTIADRFR